MAISNSKYDEIMREYNDIRTRNAHILESRREEVIGSVPEYGILEDQIANVGREGVFYALSGNKALSEESIETIKKLSGEKEKVLIKAGFPKDYLWPVYDCEACKDTGYVDNERCSCLKRRILKLMYRQSNIERVLEDENFEKLSFDYYDDSEIEQMRNIVDNCKKYVRDFDKSYENIMFMGECGVGKTYLTNCIAKALLDAGHSVIYFTSIDLFDTLAKYTFRRNEEGEEIESIHDDIFDCDLLIIDDLGTENVNSYVNTQLFLILNERDKRRKSTIISTNLTLEKLNEAYSERSFSRIFGNYRLIKPNIADIRIKKRRLAQS